MGMALGGGRKTGRGRGRRAPIGEINITPMVDVMLVLLIIFMVAAPMMTVGVPIDLPKTAASPMPLDRQPIAVTVAADGMISIDRSPVAYEALLETLAELTTEGTDERIYVRGDAGATYGSIMKVMGALSAAGYSRIGLISDPEKAI